MIPDMPWVEPRPATTKPTAPFTIMYKQLLLNLTALTSWLPLAWPILATADNLHSVPFSAVTFSDTFWAPRIETNRAATIPHLWRELEKQGSLGGFRILAGDKSTQYHGYMWGDSDVYKTLEGMTAALSLGPDPAWAQKLEQTIGSIAAAQAPDGYLFPHLQITEPGYRHFADETSRTCESYSLGHLIESAAAHYQLTGRTNYLAVARKAADLLRRVHAGGGLLRVSGHPEVELALLKLHEVTGDPGWLDLAASLIENARRVNTLWSQGHPPLAGDEAQGHAVAMLYLYSAVTDVARLKGDAELAGLMGRKWTNIVGRKLYVTGGLGHSRHSEGFAADYDLPNDIAYCETCAAIANVFWQHRLFLASGDAAYIDVLERSLYNNVLAGVSCNGDRFFYVNPLEADGRRKFNQGQAERFAWTGCPCCPVNVVRLIPRVGDYFYAVKGDEVFVNLFAAGQARIHLPGGDLVLRQDTRYPWSGQIMLEIIAAPEQAIGLRLRLPGWARGKPLPTDLYRYADSDAEPITLLLNSQPVPVTEKKGYALLRRTWHPGDRIELNLPMPVRRVLAHEQVKEDAQCVALERGPLVYCVEGIDHGGQVLNLVLPDHARLTTADRTGLLGGVTTIEASGQRVVMDSVRHGEPALLKFIPYYAWNHRGAGTMAVWLPRTIRDTRLPYDTSKWVGANYTPAYAANQVQMWHEFKPDLIERELAAAQRHLGLTSLRVYLHNLVYDAERDLFFTRLEEFLKICDRHGIKPGFTFFDDCWNHTNIYLRTDPPVDGRHNGRWAALQDAERKDENLPKFKRYVQDIIGAHREDHRVLWWETYNEPNLQDPFTVTLREQAYAWAKKVQPIQPVIACWDDHPFTDIVNAHNYEDDFAGRWNQQADMNPRKGTVFTEAGARWYDRKSHSNGSPLEVIHWLRSRRTAGQTVPGVYLCWELMVGNSNCRWYWGTPDGAPEPAIAWCGLLWPDSSPVSYAEAEAIRSYTTGDRRALLFEDFQSLANELATIPSGWTRFAEPSTSTGSRCLTLSGRAKVLAGETSWTNYLLEAAVMLKEANGNAGLVFRANDPGPGTDQLRGYYVGFSPTTLYLGRMNNAWQPLATVDLGKRPNKVELDTWHRLRVAVNDTRIRIWFDPLHDDTGPLLDLRDDQAPVLQGAIGLRVFDTSAWFDDVVVLPVQVLEDHQP
jgi:uncharacterized protein